MAYIVLVTLGTELDGLHCNGQARGTELDGLHCIGDSGDRAAWLTLYW